ncbi:MAG: hypothetical protein JW912_07000 [Sedimentisphaerales bacterium]|nr:hypothetical protein [Sedimentisphaerales bacterium]
MDFEFFKEEGRGYEPKASIRKQGQIGLNQGAVTRFKIENNQNVVLGYDRNSKTIAIKFVDEAVKGSKRAVVRSGNCSISAKAFFDYFDIPYKAKTESYSIKEDTEEGLLVFSVFKEDDISF